MCMLARGYVSITRMQMNELSTNANAPGTMVLESANVFASRRGNDWQARSNQTSVRL